MSPKTQSPEEAAEQALTRAGYSEIEITDCECVWKVGQPDFWMVSATARHQDGKRYEVGLPVTLVFGGLKGLIAQMGKREID